MSNNKKLSREEVAKIEIGHTGIAGTRKFVVCAFFLGIIYFYPLLQIGYEFSTKDIKSLADIEMFSFFRRLSSVDTGNSLLAINRQLCSVISQYEDAIEDESLLRVMLLPPAQYLLLKVFNVGNEQVIIGKDGHLFFSSCFNYLANPGFMRREQLKKRTLTGVQPDPALAVIDFYRQLQERDIALVLVPTPVKPMIYPDKLGGRPEPLNNRSFAAFKSTVERAGITVIDLTEPLYELRASGVDSFLKTDTHWTPEGMLLAARKIADVVGRKNQPMETTRGKISALGDVAGMLKLRDIHTFFQPETAEIRVVDTTPDRNAEVLLLGDSFCNIFSLEAMNWGARAGLPENLAAELGEKIDVIARNDSASFATRQLLAQELGRGRDRLAGKRVVVWQFVIRELADGDWRLIPMELRDTTGSNFLVVDEPSEITATVLSASQVPRPFAAPYNDHVMALHLVDINGGTDQALVYTVSMKDNRLTPAARLRSGERITIKVSPWSDHEVTYGNWPRSEINDDNLMLQEPLWGELQ